MIAGFLWALWGSKAARYAALVFAVLLSAKTWLWQHDKKIRDGAVQGIDIQSNKLTAEAVKAREPASKPGSTERLLKKYCGDC